MGGPPPYRYSATPPRDSGPWRTVLYTPGVTNTPRTVEHAVGNLWGTVDGLGTRATWYADPDAAVMSQPPDLLMVDEADRLKTASLEQLRDFYDRRHVGVVLIGMPGLQKRLARYAQLYSRVGFVHQFQPLSGRELQKTNTGCSWSSTPERMSRRLTPRWSTRTPVLRAATSDW